MNRRILPGFRLSLGFALVYLTLMVLVPLAACALKAGTLSRAEFWRAAWNPQAIAAYRLTFGVSLVSAAIDVVLGLLLAWVLVRYEFPLKRLIDSLVDLPLALPTAVAGLVYARLYVEGGWLGSFLVPLGIHAAYTKLAIVVVLTFIGLPFVVRALQPVLESYDADVEEAAHLLGASRGQTFLRVLLPPLVPAMITGFALAFARALGEYGSVVFVSGNIKFETQIAPVLIVERLFQLEDGGDTQATAIAIMLLVFSFSVLIVINCLESWTKRHAS